MSLNALYSTVAECTKCPLHQGRTQTVPGAGNPNADVMFIGEAPGKNEDLQGKPFVGAAGKFLDEMLEGIGLDRASVYIANVIKCRPPNNRDPDQREIDSCLPYLKEQIVLIQPKVVVTLGRFSMNLFLPDAKISQVHGKPQKLKNLLLLPLYHPAVALYNGGKRDELKKDFSVIKVILDKMKKSGEGAVMEI